MFYILENILRWWYFDDKISISVVTQDEMKMNFTDLKYSVEFYRPNEKNEGHKYPVYGFVHKEEMYWFTTYDGKKISKEMLEKCVKDIDNHLEENIQLKMNKIKKIFLYFMVGICGIIFGRNLLNGFRSKGIVGIGTSFMEIFMYFMISGGFLNMLSGYYGVSSVFKYYQSSSYQFVDEKYVFICLMFFFSSFFEKCFEPKKHKIMYFVWLLGVMGLFRYVLYIINVKGGSYPFYFKI
ncbi:hypothetical protein CWI36_0542p0020 [Hamiltosporidium magnivora]|uniref:Uncharacterized protein n=1 Tax=Hamiltosporidium magnivora TaxID=148818 RepID=A0A4Q9LER0_9MICR|nr:hypothetical protein CWI36_0542p0020 [Hamiltosporidium magnivora]